MSKSEKFGLLTGIVGLISDSIGLIAFLTGIWEPQGSSGARMPIIFSVLSILIIIYGWFSVSWFLVRRAYLLQRKMSVKKIEIGNLIERTVISVGILVFPLFIAWTVGSFRPEPMSKTEIHEKAIIYATQTAQVLTVPENATMIAGTQMAKGTVPAPPLSVEGLEDRIESSEAMGTPLLVMFSALFGLLPMMFIGVGIGVVIDYLMPVFYPDMLNK